MAEEDNSETELELELEGEGSGEFSTEGSEHDIQGEATETLSPPKEGSQSEPTNDEGQSLQTMNLDTDSSKDDFAKKLVRQGILDIDDVMEIIDENGQILGTKVLPKGEEKYFAELERVQKEADENNEESPTTDRMSFTDSGSKRSSYGTTYFSGEYETRDGQSEEGSPEEEDEEEEEEEEEETEEPIESQPEPYSFGIEGPTTIDELYELIQPDRDDAFNAEVELLNQQIISLQHEICVEHKERQKKKNTRFVFEKKLIQNAVSEAGILYLPGNLLEPITGRRLDDKDVPDILEAMKELPEQDLKGFNFAYNNITDEGIATLAPFIEERAAITHLNLSHNDFTAAGVYTLVTHLIGRSALQSLKMMGVKVGDEGINSITCLFMCGKGPRDLDVSETDMSTPGFQALCTALQAVDEDEDYPKFLTKYELPFSLETLCRLKMENHENLKAQTYHRLCHSQFELIPTREKDLRIEELNRELAAQNAKKDNMAGDRVMKEDDGLGEAFTTAYEDDTEPNVKVDLAKEVEMSVEIAEKAKELPSVQAIIEAHKNLTDKGCKGTRPDGRPVIICPSLYSLEVDNFDEDQGDSVFTEAHLPLKKANPMYMDTLVAATDADLELDTRDPTGRDAVDNLLAEKTAVKFVKAVIKEAGGIVGRSEFNAETDRAQLLLITVLNNAKQLLQADTDTGAGTNLTLAELKMIWEHSVQSSVQIFRPAVHNQCEVTDEALGVFVEEFMKISSGTFYKLIQVPFFQELLENAATKGCIDSTAEKKQEAEVAVYSNEPLDMSYQDCVSNVVIKFLEEVIARAADLVGGGDPYNYRQAEQQEQQEFPSMMDMTEEMVKPLVDQLFDAGGVLANDALTCKEEEAAHLDEGIEPARQYLEGIFKQLANFLYQMKDDDKKLRDRLEKSPKKFPFSTKPIRLVLNRPLFSGNEIKMASKLASYLRNNDSVQCLHLRKWGLGEDGTMNLLNSILTNQYIVTLDLSLNGIGSEGMAVIAQYMQKNQNLRHLLLSHNRLRNPGMSILARVVAESSIISLNVAYNDADGTGLDDLFEAIGNSNVFSLCVIGNCFSQTSAALMSDLFESQSLSKNDCDVQIQDVGEGELIVAINAQFRDANEWYEVPVPADLELTCAPYFNERYTQPKVTLFGAVDIEV